MRIVPCTQRLVVIVFVAATVALAAAPDENLPKLGGGPYQDPVTRKTVAGSAAIASLFADRGYTLTGVASSKKAPRLFVQQIPPDLSGLPTREKVDTFIALMLTNVLKVDEGILALRQQLLTLESKKKSGRKLSPAELDWLAALTTAYAAADDPDALVHRVDAVPPSLAIAQSIDESGWGTSYFAREGNALFGEHLPAQHTGKFLETPGGKVKVAAFDTVREGVAGYMHNLNTTRAYAGLRKLRAEARAKGAIPSGHDVAAGLASYSARGMGYVTTLRELIEEHDLAAYDQAVLSPQVGALLIECGN